MKFKIAVLGSYKIENEDVVEKSRKIGELIAKNDCILLTGAGTGIPYEAVKSAKANNGFTIGISPAENLQEHKEKMKLPTEGFDALFFTGFGYKGRNVVALRSCDAAIFVSGGSGTLNEFTIAYDEGKVCGILAGSGGVTEIIKELEEKYISGRKELAGTVIYESEPDKLIRNILENLNKK